MYYGFLIHSFTDGHLGCFQHLAIVNCAAMNTGILFIYTWRGRHTHRKQCGIFSKKLKRQLSFNPAILLLRLYPKNPESPVQKNVCTPMFIAVVFTMAKCWKQPKCPSVNEWIKKLWYIYTMENYTMECGSIVSF